MAINKVLYDGAFTKASRDCFNDNIADVSFCTTELDVTSSTALANITGLTTDTRSNYYLKAGVQYRFVVNLSGTSDSAGGLKIAFAQNNGLTLTSLESVAKGHTAAAVATQHSTSTTTGASLFAATAAYISVDIVGTFTVATSGSLQVQMGQNVSDSTASSIYVGSQMIITPVVVTPQ